MAAPAGAILMTGILGTAVQEEDPKPQYRANVDLVVVTFEAADAKGKPVAGLTSEDVRIFEDGIPQKIAFFTEGSTPAGASIFILFDTSNRMYKAFPYVHDSISDFVRKLDPASSVAIYTFSRNLFRAARLSQDRGLAISGLYNTVAGDDTALFNAVLLTLRDASQVPGRKAIVVFSNGSDNASMVSPYDVARVAENEGIPIHLISTANPAQDRTFTGALDSLAGRTGGKVHYVHNWKEQASAFVSVREDIESSYTASYYPSPNPNEGFRSIKVEIAGHDGREYRVRARAGYDAAEKIASGEPKTRQR
jgi:VWFA-related protein